MNKISRALDITSLLHICFKFKDRIIAKILVENNYALIEFLNFIIYYLYKCISYMFL